MISLPPLARAAGAPFASRLGAPLAPAMGARQAAGLACAAALSGPGPAKLQAANAPASDSKLAAPAAHPQACLFGQAEILPFPARTKQGNSAAKRRVTRVRVTQDPSDHRRTVLCGTMAEVCEELERLSRAEEETLF